MLRLATALPYRKRSHDEISHTESFSKAAWREFEVTVPPCASGEPCDGTVVVRNGSGVLAPTRLAPGGVVDALVDLVCDVPAVGPAPGIVGAPVLLGSFAAAVLVPLLLLRFFFRKI